VAHDREPTTSLPTAVVITMVRDGGSMLQRWCRYYGAQVGMEHLLVFDDNSTDGSTDQLPCPVVPLPEMPHAGFDRRRMQLLSGIAAGLLKVYDFVIHVDVDEFLVADPADYPGLRHFLADRMDRMVIAPVGVNVVQHLDVEGPLDERRPILGQRRFVKFTPNLCKPAIKQVPAAWRRTPHAVSAPFSVDPKLLLVHCKFHDLSAVTDVAAHRGALAEQGRGPRSNWGRGITDWEEQLRTFVGDTPAEEVPELDPAALNLADVVTPARNEWWAGRDGSQLRSLRREPLARLPERFFGLV
jgi:hypothetical protein